MQAQLTGYTAPGGEPLRGWIEDTPAYRLSIVVPFQATIPVAPGDIITHTPTGRQALVLDTRGNGCNRPFGQRITITAAPVAATAAILRRSTTPDDYGRTPSDLQETAAGIPLAIAPPDVDPAAHQDRTGTRISVHALIGKEHVQDGDALELTLDDGPTQRLAVASIDPWTWPAHDVLLLVS